MFVSYFSRLPLELRLQIYEILISFETDSLSLTQGPKSCACPTKLRRLTTRIRNVIDTCKGKRAWRSYHIPSPCRKLNLGMMTVNRTIYLEMRQVLFRCTQLRLTWDQTVELMRNPATSDLVVKLAIYQDSPGDPRLPLTSLSPQSRRKLLDRILQSQRLESLVIDLEAFYRNDAFSTAEFNGIEAFLDTFLLKGPEWECLGLGCYRFRAGGSLGKLQVRHELLISIWDQVISSDEQALETMAMLYHEHAFDPSRRNRWACKFPPLCQRIYLCSVAWLSALRLFILHAQKLPATHGLWPGWDDMIAADAMLGSCALYNHRWTHQMSKVLSNNRSYLMLRERACRW